MKTLATFISALICLSFIEAAEISHRAKIIKITSEIQQTPQFQVSGIKDKAVVPRYWLEIEAEIEVETTDPSGYIPELEAKWFAVIIDKSKEKPESVRLLGTTTFKNLKTKNKNVMISAYIEPDVLEKLTGSNKPSQRDIEAIALTISGPGIVNEGRHEAGLMKATAKEEAKWWIEWKNANLDDVIVAKSKTPFAPLWTDRYPAEKTANP